MQLLKAAKVAFLGGWIRKVSPPSWLMWLGNKTTEAWPLSSNQWAPQPGSLCALHKLQTGSGTREYERPSRSFKGHWI